MLPAVALASAAALALVMGVDTKRGDWPTVTIRVGDEEIEARVGDVIELPMSLTVNPE